MTRNGKVVVKIITGSEGCNIPALAESLRKNPTTDSQELVKRCHEHDLVSTSVVVQLSTDDWRLPNADDDFGEIPPRYKEKFHDPCFNPRWTNGTAA